MSQSDPVFKQAFDIVRSRHSAQEWSLMSPHQITREIYIEVRSLDLSRGAEMAVQQKEAKRPTDWPV